MVYDDKTWSGYLGFEGKYLLGGSKYEIEGVFEGTDINFLSRGYKENGIMLGANIGGSVRIVEGLKFFVNANAYTANKFTNVYGNAGLRYNFCGITHKEKQVAVQEPAAQETPAVKEPVQTPVEVPAAPEPEPTPVITEPTPAPVEETPVVTTPTVFSVTYLGRSFEFKNKADASNFIERLKTVGVPASAIKAQEIDKHDGVVDINN